MRFSIPMGGALLQMLLMISLLAESISAQLVNEMCKRDDYYNHLLSKDRSLWTRDDLEDLLRSTHTNITPFYSSNPGEGDVLAALMVLDPGSIDQMIQLFYTNTQEPMDSFDRSLWVPEHVCPVVMSTVRPIDFDLAFSDLHNIRPVHPDLHEGSRGTIYFGICPICNELVQEGSDTCICGDFFQPPESSRGIVARSWLYMQLRYPDLPMSKCHLEQLLAWHASNPPSSEEKLRNRMVCSHYQGNRNPYVDFPDLAWNIRMYETTCEDTANYGDAVNSEGNQKNQTIVEDATSVPNTNTNTNTNDDDGDDDDQDNEDNADDTEQGVPDNIFDIDGKLENNEEKLVDPCSVLLPGDIYFYSVQASPTRIGMIPLMDLPQGLVLYISDTLSFASSTTSVKVADDYPDLPLQRLTLVEIIEKGSPFGYGRNLFLGDDWEVVTQPVTLRGDAFGGDELFLFCYDQQDQVNLLAALTTNGAFRDAAMDEIGFGKVILPFPMDYYVYNGPLYSTNSDYQQALMDPTNWLGFDVIASEETVAGDGLGGISTVVRQAPRGGESSSPPSGYPGLFLLFVSVFLLNIL